VFLCAGRRPSRRGSLTHPSFAQTANSCHSAGAISHGKSHLKLVTPTEVNRTVAPVRRPNAELRTQEHLTPGEVEALVEAAILGGGDDPARQVYGQARLASSRTNRGWDAAAIIRHPRSEPADVTSSVNTLKPASMQGPKEVTIATSVASRPQMCTSALRDRLRTMR
jgi:hypothetical protein